MKLYRRKDFLKLPPGTMYFKGEPHAYGEFSVKGETLDHGPEATGDFFCLNLESIDMGKDSGELMERMDAMLEQGASYPLNADYGRDGCFDENDVFLVFEDADLDALINHCKHARRDRPAVMTYHVDKSPEGWVVSGFPDGRTRLLSECDDDLRDKLERFLGLRDWDSVNVTVPEL